MAVGKQRPAFFKYFSRCERPILTSCERCERTRSRTNARIGAKDRGESRSSVMDRPSRRGASKADKAAAAASQLKSLREKGTKRLDTVEDLEDNDVYTSVRTRGTRMRRRGRDGVRASARSASRTGVASIEAVRSIARAANAASRARTTSNFSAVPTIERCQKNTASGQRPDPPMTHSP